MNVTITNNGINTVRVILDHDDLNDEMLEPSATADYSTRDEGVLELRELGGTEAGADAQDEAQA